MWFLNFCLISFVVTVIVSHIQARVITVRIKRNYAVIYRQKLTLAEKVSTYIKLAIPVYNILVILCALFAEDLLYRESVKKLLDMGCIEELQK